MTLNKPTGILRTIIFSVIFALAIYGTSFAEDEIIVIKSIATNPSKTQSHTLPFKTYLPEGITPELIIDSDGLNIEYDYLKGQFYAYKEIKLTPKETKTFKIKVRDIWKIPKGKIGELQNKYEEMLKEFENNSSLGMAKEDIKDMDSAFNKLYQNMYSNSKIITPTERIKQHNETLKLMKMVDAMLYNFSQIASMLEAQQAEANLPEEQTNSKDTVWYLILGICSLMVIISTVFFFLWYKNIKPSQKTIEKGNNIIEPIKGYDNLEIKKINKKKKSSPDISALKNFFDNKKES